MALKTDIQPLTAEHERNSSPLKDADFNHVHIDVKDYDRAQKFYERHFGFKPIFELPPDHERSVRFIRNAHGFTLGLELQAKGTFPSWFHFGFRLKDAAAVKEAHAYFEKQQDVVILKGFVEDPDYVSFVLLDPDGHHIEIFWDLDW